MFCKNCGKELPDGVKFCNACGAPVTPPPEAGGPAPDSGFIPTPGPTMGPAAGPDGGFVPGPGPAQPGNYPGAETAVKASPAAGLAAKLKGNKTGLIILGVGAVAVIAVIVLLVNVIGGLLGGGGSKPLYAYLNDDYELMYLPGLSQDAESVEISDKTGSSTGVQFAPDGKTLYFTDADNSLYKIAVAGLTKEGGKPERIKKDVSMFRVLQDGRILFREYDSGKLSVYDGEETFTLVKEYDSYQLSEDHKALYYTELDDDGTRTLYRIAIDKDAGKEKLLDGADAIYTSWDAETLVYGEGGYTYGASQDEGDRNTLAVYACKPGEKAEKLIDDIYSITGVTVDGGKVSFHYYIQNVEERTLYDFVTDTNAGADASTLSGEAPVYPSWSDYSPRNYGIEADGTTVYYTDRSGAHYTIPASVIADILSGTDRTVSDLRTYELSSYANDDARERYDADMEDYNTRRDTWNEAQTREYVRQSLKDTSYNQTSLSLYHYTGSDKNEPIATQISSGSRIASASDGIFLYRKVSLEGGKVADVADLDYAGEVRSLLSEGAGGDDWYQNVGGKESVIDLDDVSGIYSIYVLNGKEVVLDVYDEDGVNMLQAFSLGKEALTFTSTIIDDDFTGPYWGQSSGKDVLYLFTDPADDSSGTVGDFSVYRDGKLETIAKEVYGALILDESGATYVVADLDSRSYSAELALLKDGKTTTISDEVSGDFIFLDDTQLLYLSDGDLMLWDGKQERRIARDVEEFWASVSEEYTSYSPN